MPVTLSLRTAARTLAPLLCAAFAGVAAAAPAEFAYTVNAGSNSISMYRVDAATGQLVDNGSIATGTYPQAIHVVSSGQYAWVTNYLDDNVSLYKVNNVTGKLSVWGPPDHSARGASPQSVASAPYGNFVYVTYSGSGANCVLTMTFDEDHGRTATGCAATGLNPHSVVVHPSGRFAYVTNSGSSSVSAFAIGGGGKLTSLGAAVAASGHPMGITLHPNGRFAYVANDASGVLVYAINILTGALTPAGTASAGTRPQSVTIDPSGTYAYVANYGNSTVNAYRVNSSTGALTALGSHASGPNPKSIMVDPSGQFVYTANNGGGSSTAFRISASSGALTRVGDASSQTSPVSIAVSKATSVPRTAYVLASGIDVHDVNSATGSIRLPVVQSLRLGLRVASFDLAPSGKFAYAISGDLAGAQLRVLSVAGDGTLSLVQTLERGGHGYSQIAVAPAGNYAYVTDDANLVRIFSVNADNGSLSEIGNVSTGNSPVAMTFTSSGSFLQVKNERAETIWTYAVNKTSGALTRVSGSLSLPDSQLKLVTHPSGNLVFAVDSDNTVRSYAVGSNGKLTQVATLVVGGYAGDFALDPSGSFLYVLNSNVSNTVSAIRVSSGGALSLVGVSSLPASMNSGLRGLEQVSVDPSGHFVYVVKHYDNTLTTFAIDRSTGALTQLGNVQMPTTDGSSMDSLTLRGTSLDAPPPLQWW